MVTGALQSRVHNLLHPRELQVLHTKNRETQGQTTVIAKTWLRTQHMTFHRCDLQAMKVSKPNKTHILYVEVEGHDGKRRRPHQAYFQLQMGRADLRNKGGIQQTPTCRVKVHAKYKEKRFRGPSPASALKIHQSTEPERMCVDNMQAHIQPCNTEHVTMPAKMITDTDRK